MTEGEAGAAPETTIYHPAPSMAFIAEEEQEMVPILRSEIERFAAAVRKLGNPIESATAWAFTYLGVAVAAALALAVLYGSEETSVAAWVMPAHWAVLLASGFLAAFLGWFGRQRRQEQRNDADDLAAEIERVSDRAPRPSSTAGTWAFADARSDHAAP